MIKKNYDTLISKIRNSEIELKKKMTQLSYSYDEIDFTILVNVKTLLRFHEIYNIKKFEFYYKPVFFDKKEKNDIEKKRCAVYIDNYHYINNFIKKIEKKLT